MIGTNIKRKKIGLNQKKIVCAITLVLIVIIIAMYVIFDTPNELQLIQSADVVQSTEVLATTATERKWMDDLFGEEQVLKPAIRDSVYRGMIIKYIGNYLYVAYFNDMRIKRFNPDGSFASAFGKGKGHGPGELLLPIGFACLDNKYIYVVDSYKREMVTFDRETTDYITSFSIKYQPYRMIPLGDHLLVEGLNQENMFTKHSVNGNIEGNFGTIIEDQVQNFMSLSGEIAALDDGSGFVFAPSKASYLFYFDQDGKRTKTIQTIDKISFKESINNSQGNVRTIRPPNSPVETFDIRIFGDKIYLSQLCTDEEENAHPLSFLDVYNLDSGSYLYSVGLPVQTRNVVFTEERIYLLTKDTESVKAYAYNEK